MPIVTFRTGNYSDYDNSNYQTGALYFLTDSSTGRNRIFLNGVEYESVNKAQEVTMSNQSITVTKSVGNYEVGQTIPANISLETLLRNMLESDIYPVANSPVVTLTTSGWSSTKYEVGTSLTLNYACSLSQGSYSVSGQPDQLGGVTATGYRVEANVTNTSGTVNIGTTASGSLGTVVLGDGSTVSVTAVITGSQGSMPQTFLGNDYPSVRFAAGATYSKTYGTAQGARKYFIGSASNVSTDYSSLTGDDIRSLGTGSFTAPTTISTSNMQEMFFAAPHAAGHTSISIIDSTTSLPQTVTKYISTVNVKGANDYAAVPYDVWYVKNAAPEIGSSTFTVIWN